MLNELVGNHHLVQALWSAVNTSAGSLVNVAPLVKKILTTEAWKERVVEQLGGRTIKFERFVDFIKTPPLAGCGWPPDKVEALIKDDAETLALWRDAVTPEKHVHHDSDNVTITADDRGNSRSYTLSRLKRERPDLFEKVAAKKLSANAAAIEAGFRKVPTPFEQIKKLLPKCSRAEKIAISEQITNYIANKEHK